MIKQIFLSKLVNRSDISYVALHIHLSVKEYQLNIVIFLNNTCQGKNSR